MVTAVFTDSRHTTAYGLWQYDYGQTLRIQGLDLPTAVEVHFALDASGGDAITRMGVTSNGVTNVPVPDSLLENGDTELDYEIYAYIYVVNRNSGETQYSITIPVTVRPKPEALDMPEEDAELFREAINAVNESAEVAENAATVAEEASRISVEASETATEVVNSINEQVKDTEIHAGNAAMHAGEAKMYATLAEQSAATHGFFYTYIDKNTGHLHYVRSDGLVDLNMRIVDGRLIASYGVA